MLGSGELPGLTWTWEEKVESPSPLASPGTPPTYRYEVRLYPEAISTPPDCFRGFRLASSRPLPWFEEGVEAFLSRLSPTLSWVNFPLIFERDPWAMDWGISFFALGEEATQTAYAPCDLLLLAFLEAYLNQDFLSLVLSGQADQKLEWFHHCLSPQQALALVPSGPLGALLEKGETRENFLTAPGQGLFALPAPNELQGCHLSGREEEKVAVAVLLHLLVPEERKRAVEVVEVYRRWQKHAPTVMNLYSVLVDLPWDSCYAFPESLWQDLLAQEGEKAWAVGSAFSKLLSRGGSSLPLPALLSSLLEVEPLSGEEFEKVVVTWSGQEPSAYYRTDFFRWVFDAPFRFLQEVEEAGLHLHPEERCRLWQALTACFFSYPGINKRLPTPLAGGDLFLLPVLQEALGLPALVDLLVQWEDDYCFTCEGMEEFLAHPEWWACPPSWWIPLLEEAEG